MDQQSCGGKRQANPKETFKVHKVPLVSESTVVQLNSTAYDMGHNNHLGSLLIHSTQTMSIWQSVLYQRSLANGVPRKELYEGILRLLRITVSMTEF